MGYASKLIFYIIPILLLVVVAVIFFGESGIWEETKVQVLGLKDYVPDVGLGLNELHAEKVVTPFAIKQQINAMVHTIQKEMLTRTREEGRNCFAQVGPITVEERGVALSFVRKPDGTRLVVRGGAGGKQVDTNMSQTIPGMVPCVVAGDKLEAENFFEFFMQGGNRRAPYTKKVSSLTIYNKDQDLSIAILDLGHTAFEDDLNNFESNWWLFTPDGVEVCFFPTNAAVNADKDGIDNDYFLASDSNSIPSRVNGPLTLCTNEN